MTTKAGYWIGGLLIAFSVVGAIIWGVTGFLRIDDKVDAFQRIAIPAARTVDLPGDKVILYVEGPRVDELTPAVSVTVTDPRSEARVPVASYGGSLTYSLGTTGTAIATVTAPRAGRYVVRTAGERAGAYNLAIGDSIAGGIVSTILGAFAVGGVFALGGTALIAVTSIRRSRRRAAAASPPNPFGS